MLVKDLMSSSVACAAPEDTLERIIFIMKSEDVGILPVCDKQNHVLGVITDRDVILRQDKAHTASELMSENVITVNAGDDIHQAALKFSKHGIHRLPVIENQRLIGILSLKDMAKKKVFTAEIGHIIYNIYNHK